MISYALVMIVSLATGQPTQAFVEGPMSDSWCTRLIERHAYNAQDGTSVRVPTCLSWPEAQQALVQNSCTRDSWTDRRRRRLFDCTAPTDALPTPAALTTAVSRAAAWPDAVDATSIERNNPLLWVELGQLRSSTGDAAQADGISRRALALSEGDGRVQAMAWHIIAESLRARGRNSEAAEADRQAIALVPQ